MLKGVTKRIVEIKNPTSDYFERAVLYLRPNGQLPEGSSAEKLAEEYLSAVDPNSGSGRRDLRLLVAVLSLSLGLSLTALAVLLVLFTKI